MEGLLKLYFWVDCVLGWTVGQDRHSFKLWQPLVRNENIFKKLFSDFSVPGLVPIQEVMFHKQVGKSLPHGGRA